MLKKIFNFWPWLFLLLLIPYSYYVWTKTPSHSQNNPECSEYAANLSRYEVVTAATGDTPKKHETKHDEKVNLKAKVECSDLHAQWAMADITFWAFGAGIAGILLVFATLIATRRGVRLTEDASQRGLRAYVGIQIIKSEAKMMPQGIARPKPIPRPDDSDVAVAVIFKNVGQTPANKIQIAYNKTIVDDGSYDALPALETKSEMGAIMPEGIRSIDIRVSEENGWIDTQKSILDGKKGIFIYGVITYEDIYARKRETKFSAYLKGGLDGENFIIGRAEDNYMT